MSLKSKHLTLAALFVSLPLMASDSPHTGVPDSESDSTRFGSVSRYAFLLAQAQAHPTHDQGEMIRSTKSLFLKVKNEFSIFVDQLDKMRKESRNKRQLDEILFPILNEELGKIKHFENPEEKLFNERNIQEIFSSNNVSISAGEILEGIKWDELKKLHLIKGYRNAMTDIEIALALKGYKLPIEKSN